MKKLKTLYLVVLCLTISVCMSLSVLGNILAENMGKDPDTVSVVLPSMPFRSEGSVETWKVTSETNVFDFSSRIGRDKLIKPGMSNSVEIRVDNRNGHAVDYDIIFNFGTTVEGVWVPLQFKITRYDGDVITNNYETMEALDGLEDRHTVGGYRYTYYLVEWVWPMGGDDTEFGNLAASEDFRVFVNIDVSTWQSIDVASLNGELTTYNHNHFWTAFNILLATTPIIASIVGASIFYHFEIGRYHLSGDITQFKPKQKAPKARKGYSKSGRKCPIKVSAKLKYRYLKVRQYFDKNGRLRKDFDYTIYFTRKNVTKHEVINAKNR